MSDVAFEKANLLLKIYDLRREPRLRQARSWFLANFMATSLEEVIAKFPPGSEANTNVRMVTSYWEMVAGLFNKGLLDEDLFFENNGEVWVVWDRIKDVAASMRAVFKNPHALVQLEECARRLEEWREKRAPGSTEVIRQMTRQMVGTQAKTAGS